MQSSNANLFIMNLDIRFLNSNFEQLEAFVLTADHFLPTETRHTESDKN